LFNWRGIEKSRDIFRWVLWTEQLLSMHETRARITGIVGKREESKGIKCWIAEKKILELWNINIRCGKYCKYLSVWSKVTLGYALEIWDECTKRFPTYDWISYNNKALKKVNLEEDITSYKEYGTIYLKIAIKGGKKTERERIIELLDHWNKYIDRTQVPLNERW
jgi:hypothetical protein